jgi:hypothetical protein
VPVAVEGLMFSSSIPTDSSDPMSRSSRMCWMFKPRGWFSIEGIGPSSVRSGSSTSSTMFIGTAKTGSCHSQHGWRRCLLPSSRQEASHVRHLDTLSSRLDHWCSRLDHWGCRFSRPFQLSLFHERSLDHLHV